MKRLIILFLMLVPFSVFAQEQVEAPQVFWAMKPIQCGHPDEIIKIPESYGEKPMITGTGLALNPNGTGVPVKIVFGVNTETGTWTLIEINGENQACVLGSGKDLMLIKPDNSKKIGT